MANDNERFADIIAEMRDEIAVLRAISPSIPSAAAEWWENRVDRLEAAHKREAVGDAAKLREAVEYISQYADCAAMRQHDAATQHYIEQIRKWAKAALDAPPRNCDRFDNEEDAFNNWSTTIGKNYKFGQGGYGMAWAFTKWLFAEAKGDGQ